MFDEREFRLSCLPSVSLLCLGLALLSIPYLVLPLARDIFWIVEVDLQDPIWSAIVPAVGVFFLMVGMRRETTEIRPEEKKVILRTYFLLLFPVRRRVIRFRQIQSIRFFHPSVETRPVGGPACFRDDELPFGYLPSLPEIECFYPYQVQIRLEDRERLLISRIYDHDRALRMAQTVARLVRKPVG
jgi:hypothetical protein